MDIQETDKQKKNRPLLGGMSHIQKLQLRKKRSQAPLQPHQITCRGHAMSTHVPDTQGTQCQHL
jgi:hypothetical protein